MRQLLTVCLLLLLGSSAVAQQEAKARTEPIRVKVGETPVVTMADLGITRQLKYHALIIGISDYQNNGPSLSDLERPVQDAERLYDVLTNRYTFSKENITFLRNPTYQAITDSLLRLSERIGQDENLLIFYAGHGYYDRQREFGYWIPSDASMTSRSRWISNTTLRDNIAAIRQAKHTLLITDACFGGSIFKGTRSAYEANLLTRFREAYNTRSRKAITSGNLSEVPDKSLFIEQLIKRLEENTDPYISAFSLFNKIYDVIINNSETSPRYGAIQNVGDEGGDFVFIRR